MDENILRILNGMVVNGNKYGIIGSGNNNTVINYINGNQTWDLFENFNRSGKTLNKGVYALAFLDAFNNFSEYIVESVEQGQKNHNNPISVKMNEVIDYCALLLYNNGVSDNEYAWDFIKKLLAAIATLCGWNYDVKVVRVANNIIFELFEIED